MLSDTEATGCRRPPMRGAGWRSVLWARTGSSGTCPFTTAPCPVTCSRRSDVSGRPCSTSIITCGTKSCDYVPACSFVQLAIDAGQLGDAGRDLLDIDGCEADADIVILSRARGMVENMDRLDNPADVKGCACQLFGIDMGGRPHPA